MRKILMITLCFFCILFISGCNELEGSRLDDKDTNPYREFVNASFYEITLSDLYLYRVIEIDSNNNYFKEKNFQDIEYYNVITVEILKSYNNYIYNELDNRKAFLENDVFSETESQEYLINEGKQIKISIPSDCVELFTEHNQFIGKIKPIYTKVYYKNYQNIDYIINSNRTSLLFDQNIFPVVDECIDFSLLSSKQLQKNNLLSYDEESTKIYVKQVNNEILYNLVIENYFYNLMFLNRYSDGSDIILEDGITLDGFLEWLNFTKSQQIIEWGEDRYSSYPSVDDDYGYGDAFLLPFYR